MNIDWNWFFSSFSQSAAALLGIIGAFIISRLIGIDEKVNNLSSDFDNLQITYDKIKNGFSVRKYNWINRIYIVYDNDDLIKQIKNREFDGLTYKEILKIIYGQDPRLYKSDTNILKEFKELYEKNKPEDEPERIPGQFYVSKPIMPILNITPAGIWTRISQERDKINQLIIDSSELIKKFEKHLRTTGDFENSLNTIRIIIWTLIISFPLIVIYPLHFLPMAIGEKPELTYNLIEIITNFINLQNILLIMFLISIEGIFIYFLMIIKGLKIRLTNIEQENIDDFRNISSYCDYYRE